MKIIDSNSLLSNIEKGWVLSIGNFDGLHLGHLQIIQAAKKAVADTNAPGLAVMTFDPHPVAILHPEKAPGVLTPLSLKQHLLTDAGVDCMIILKDSYDLLNLSPADFVDKFLLATAAPTVIVEGGDFNFGYGRSGDIDLLKQLGKQRSFDVIQVPPHQVHLNDRRSVVCSSSLIRNLLETGNVQDAAIVLGRNYRLIGQTVKGRGVGTEIGFPTANIDPVRQIIPGEGVYAGYVSIGDTADNVCGPSQQINAVFSIGRAKTFITDHPLLIEAHILDQPVTDLYGKHLAMDFVRKIRSQKRFENRDSLKKQIAEDCTTAKNILSSTEIIS
jgi:riboflavin kinase/FMN adenylyltransferase